MALGRSLDPPCSEPLRQLAAEGIGPALDEVDWRRSEEGFVCDLAHHPPPRLPKVPCARIPVEENRSVGNQQLVFGALVQEPAPAPAPRPAPPVPPPPPSVGAPPVARPPVLSGYRLSDRKGMPAKFSLSTAESSDVECFVNEVMHGRDFRVTRSVIPYVGERRLVTDRNVVECKQDLEVVTITTVRSEGLPLSAPVLGSVGAIAGAAVGAAASLLASSPIVDAAVSPVALLSSEAALGAASWFARVVAGITSIPLGVLAVGKAVATASLGLLLDPSRSYMLPLLAAGAGACSAFWRKRMCDEELSYAPHIVTCLLQSFPTTCSPSVAVSTIRQKALRLATIAVPDHSWVALVAGSEAVALWVITHGKYFSNRVEPTALRPLT